MISYVKQHAVGRAYQSVGPDHIIDHANQFFAIGGQIIYMFAVLFEVFPGPIARIGKINTSPGSDPQVIWAV